MSQYTHIVHSSCITTIDELNDIIINRDEHWPGLTTAEQIISIQWDPGTEMYIVWWRDRKWMDSSESLQSGSLPE